MLKWEFPTLDALCTSKVLKWKGTWVLLSRNSLDTVYEFFSCTCMDKSIVRLCVCPSVSDQVWPLWGTGYCIQILLMYIYINPSSVCRPTAWHIRHRRNSTWKYGYTYGWFHYEDSRGRPWYNRYCSTVNSIVDVINISVICDSSAHSYPWSVLIIDTMHAHCWSLARAGSAYRYSMASSSLVGITWMDCMRRT